MNPFLCYLTTGVAEVPEAFYEWVFKNNLNDKYLMNIVGTTRYTRYYKFVKK